MDELITKVYLDLNSINTIHNEITITNQYIYVAMTKNTSDARLK